MRRSDRQTNIPAPRDFDPNHWDLLGKDQRENGRSIPNSNSCCNLREEASEAAFDVLEAKRNATEHQIAERLAEDIDQLRPEQQMQVMARLAIWYGLIIDIAGAKAIQEAAC